MRFTPYGPGDPITWGDTSTDPRSPFYDDSRDMALQTAWEDAITDQPQDFFDELFDAWIGGENRERILVALRKVASMKDSDAKQCPVLGELHDALWDGIAAVEKECIEADKMPEDIY